MPVVLLFTMLLLMAGCGGGKSSSAKTARQQDEAARLERMAAMQSEERKSRLHTLRILGFAALSGGAVLTLIWAGKSRPSSGVFTSPQSRPVIHWQDHVPPRQTGRIIDMRDPGRPTEPAAPSGSGIQPVSRNPNPYRSHMRRNQRTP